MARISFVGLGGGGCRYVSEVFRWLTAENARKPSESSDLGGWLFGFEQALGAQVGGVTPVALRDAVGLVGLDVASGDLDPAMAILGEESVYRLVERLGFGGIRAEAFLCPLRILPTFNNIRSHNRL